MNKQLSIDEMIPLILEQIDRGGRVNFTPAGNSMSPMLRDKSDTVVMTKPTFPLKKYDLVLYVRENGNYVLHRVVDITDDGYVLRGDNQVQNEYGIKEDNILAIVEEFVRKGKRHSVKSIKYRCYCICRVNTVKIRRMAKGLRRICGRIKRKMLNLLG